MRKIVLYLSILTLLVLSATGYYIYSDLQDNNQIESAEEMSTETFEGEVRTASIEEEGNMVVNLEPEVLHWGSTGKKVKSVQWKLLQWGYYNGAVDGIYGTQTSKAVSRFQRKNGLGVDGVVGQRTAAALGLNFIPKKTNVGKKGTATAGISRDDDISLLARAVHAEARGETYIGKVAVAAVVLNRVDHPSFPNTIAGVIYQPLAFTAVADGQINLTPDQESIKAARDAINGWDPSYGCLYYWNPATSSSKWIWSRQVVIKLGKHWFGN